MLVICPHCSRVYRGNVFIIDRSYRCKCGEVFKAKRHLEGKTKNHGFFSGVTCICGRSWDDRVIIGCIETDRRIIHGTEIRFFWMLWECPGCHCTHDGNIEDGPY